MKMEAAGFNLAGVPGELKWANPPLAWKVETGSLSITAGAGTNLFIDPAGTRRRDDAPAALFAPPDGPVILRAMVAVDFASTYDAGALLVRGQGDLWAKFCLEYSPQSRPMIVSVVTRGVSDDCNSAVIHGDQVYLRVAWLAPAFAFHYSTDGRFWHLARYFALDELADPLWGFLAQSPTGRQCRAVFTEIDCRRGRLTDIRSGE